MVYCIHHVPGRARFKVPRLKQDRDFAKEIDEKLSALPGVTRVEINHSAWSVIVHYDAAMESDPLQDAVLHMHGGTLPITTEPGGPNPIPLTPKANGHDREKVSRGVGKIVGQAVFATLVQRTLERSLLHILTGGLR
ncbi:heavy-metal-associated domain-containing protein [Methyloligella sp. 2.7D]|uniref:heavy-metal-associated domain-containing protein n=1 Tax=unclassified Methyloligella TaxID=2625955 RepID=UPI00157E27C8|nr:heavy-metal-associated domain-containing protein [Methyloligella sp. GL2]QKP78107.1 heavy-metal-associated domain-containing protein [Methyloligella sp. GL2]